MEKAIQKETVVYGGAFNPPTLAHQAILEACVEYAERNRADVWVLPSGNREDKTISTSRETRLKYLEALIKDTDKGDISPAVITTELDRNELIETYDTVKELEQNYPNRRFRFVFGADSTQTMASWKMGEALLEDLSMLVIEREGSTINPLARHAVLLSVKTPNVSSTEVRARLVTGASVEELVGPSVARLVQQNACVSAEAVA